MATFYSDQLSTGLSASAPALLSGAKAGTRAHISYHRAEIVFPTTAAAADVFAMLPLRSGARLLELHIADSVTATALVKDIGLYKLDPVSGALGVVLDADLFGTVVGSSATRTEVFQEAATGLVQGRGRGRRLWELMGLATDPLELWAICATLTTVTALTAVTAVIAEAYVIDN